MNLKQLFIDPSENEVAILGGGYLQNFINNGSLENGFCIVSNKRVYFKGKCYHRVNNKFTKSKEEKTVDLKDITGVSFRNNNHLALRLFFWIITAIVYIVFSFIFRYTYNPIHKIILMAIPVLPCFLIALIVELKSKRMYYEIQFAGGCIAFDASKYSDDELKSFQRSLLQAKDKKIAEERILMQTVSVNTPIENKSNTNKSMIEELKDLKELLDCGAINQEEYEHCKEKILRS